MSKKVSADKMMTKAKGPVWHKKQKKKGIIPKGLKGVDKQATWGKSRADGWQYGHGTFCLTPHEIPIVGIFQWMPNSGNEAKRMEQEIVKYTGIIKRVFMDSKADDQHLYRSLKKNYKIKLVTSPRRNMDKTESRRAYMKEMLTKRDVKEYQKRSTTVEPMQGIVKDIFDLEVCWMRGSASNRWLFAAMGIAVQMAQFRAYREKRSTWKIKSDVLGLC